VSFQRNNTPQPLSRGDIIIPSWEGTKGWVNLENLFGSINNNINGDKGT